MPISFDLEGQTYTLARPNSKINAIRRIFFGGTEGNVFKKISQGMTNTEYIQYMLPILVDEDILREIAKTLVALPFDPPLPEGLVHWGGNSDYTLSLSDADLLEVCLTLIRFMEGMPKASQPSIPITDVSEKTATLQNLQQELNAMLVVGPTAVPADETLQKMQELKKELELMQDVEA
jgi:hypothetical protein